MNKFENERRFQSAGLEFGMLGVILLGEILYFVLELDSSAFSSRRKSWLWGWLTHVDCVVSPLPDGYA
jgi:hypothetical protein